MNAINRTTIALQVKGIFAYAPNASTDPSIFQALSAKLEACAPVPYELGKFAEHDYRVCVSAIFSLRNRLVSLQYAPDKVVNGAGRDTDTDNGTPNEAALANQKEIDEVIFNLAVFERHAVSLAETARKDLEEAGKTIGDGGKTKTLLKNPVFKEYLNTWDAFLADKKATAKPETTYARKIAMAELIEFPNVSAQDATDLFEAYFDEDTLTRVSLGAWDKLREALQTYGECVAEHQEQMAIFNELPKTYRDAKKSDVAAENLQYRSDVRNSEYWINRFLAPWALLCHTGVPLELIESPEWRTAAAYKRVTLARAKIAEVNAQALELEAMNAEAEAYNALATARQRMAALAARNEALMNPKAPPTYSVQQQPALTPEAPPKGVKPNGGGITIINGGNRIPSYTYR